MNTCFGDIKDSDRYATQTSKLHVKVGEKLLCVKGVLQMQLSNCVHQTESASKVLTSVGFDSLCVTEVERDGATRVRIFKFTWRAIACDYRRLMCTCMMLHSQHTYTRVLDERGGQWSQAASPQHSLSIKT